MGWPDDQSYQEAVQNPALAFDDPDLRASDVESDGLGMPKARSGNFAVVYKATGRGRAWAVRCFKKEIDGQHERYVAIAAKLRNLRLPFTVPFDYLPSGIRVQGRRYPLIKMEWVQGDGLIPYVERHLTAPARLVGLADALTDLAGRLSAHQLAHGDLQHGNILVVNDRPVLVDYDGMFVPDLRDRRATEVGHPSYQHPNRSPDHFGPGLDNFSVWVIALSLHALAADPGLWARYDGGDDCLVFRRRDLTAPANSRLLQDLERSRDLLVRLRTSWFRQLLDLDPTAAPPFGIPPPVVRQPSKPPDPLPRLPSDPVPVGGWLTIPGGGPGPVGEWLELPGATVPPLMEPDPSVDFLPVDPVDLPSGAELPSKQELELDFVASRDIDQLALVVTGLLVMAVVVLTLIKVVVWPFAVAAVTALTGSLLFMLRPEWRRAVAESVAEQRRAIRGLEGAEREAAAHLGYYSEGFTCLERDRSDVRAALKRRLEVARQARKTVPDHVARRSWSARIGLLRRELDELARSPQMAAWAARVSAQKRRLRRVRRLLAFARSEMLAAHRRLSFGRYLRSLA